MLFIHKTRILRLQKLPHFHEIHVWFVANLIFKVVINTIPKSQFNFAKILFFY